MKNIDFAHDFTLDEYINIMTLADCDEPYKRAEELGFLFTRLAERISECLPTNNPLISDVVIEHNAVLKQFVNGIFRFINKADFQLSCSEVKNEN